MSIETWGAFVIAATVLLVIPGPTILTVIVGGSLLSAAGIWALLARREA